MSLDAFRGMVIATMFLVNVAGSDPAFPEWFEHRGWNNGRHGQGLADFVFPWFLFIVGAAVPFSMNFGRGANKSAMRKVANALRRGVTIYLLGTLLWCATIAFDPKTPITLRVFLHWDILPLIGFAYFVGVLVWLLPLWLRVGFVAAVLVAKWLVISMIAHPEAGLVDWLRHLTYQDWLRSRFGWGGTLLTQGMPSAATAVLGSLTSAVLISGWKTPAARSGAILLGGTLFVILSVVWHAAWNSHPLVGMPYSKDYFTSSYVLLAAGSGAVILGIFHELCDVRGLTNLTALRVPGLNAIAIYFTAECIWKMVMVRWFVACPDGSSAWAITAVKAWLQSVAGSATGSWLTVALYMMAYWFFSYWLYRRKLFIRV